MKVKLHQFLTRMSKLGIYVIILIVSVSSMMATETLAQRQYLSEIYIHLDKQVVALPDLVSDIEAKTNFYFAYLDKSLLKKQISLDHQNWRMDDLLREVSVQARVSLKRVNESIAIIDANETTNLPELIEEVKIQWSISGSILGEDNTGIPFANVLLLHAADSSFVKGSVTDGQGVYLIPNVDPGNYVIQSYMIGFSKNHSSVFRVADRNITLNPIRLSESVQELDGVVIKADKPLFEQTIDRLVVNVEASPIMAGNSVLEILEKSPGVNIDRLFSTININGKSGVMVMINGKMNRMRGDALFAYLESTSSQNIERIELITTPPAKYDAEGDAGFINIVLKKNEYEGVNGAISVMAGHGRKERLQMSGNIDYRTQKLNLFGNLSYDHNQHHFIQDYSREINDPQSHLISTSDYDRIGGHDFFSARVGADFYLGSKTTFGILGDFYIRDYKANMTTYSLYDYEPGIDTLSNSLRRNLDLRTQSLINFNIVHKFDQKQQIEINVDRLHFNTDQDDQYDNDFFSQDGESLLVEDIFINRTFPFRFWIGKVDYKLKIGEKAQFETGAKATLNMLTNDVITERLSNGLISTDPDFTFFNDMNENIIAGYGSLSATFGKMTFKSGLRYEHTTTDIRNESELPVVNRTYGNFFPSIFLSRKFNKKSSLNISYTKRINRPSFYELSPGQKFQEPRVFITGNTQLFPSLTHTIQASWTWNKVILSMQYDRINNDIGILPTRKEDSDVVIVMNWNFDKTEMFGLRFAFPVIITDWWEMNNNFEIFNKSIFNIYNADVQSLSTRYFNGNSFHRFKMGKGFSGEISGFYRSGNIYGISKSIPLGGINIGFRKKLSGNGGAISLNISDIFKTINTRYQSILTGNFIFTNYSNWDTRVFRITYTNSFGNSQLKSRSKRKGGAGDDLKRIQ
ncbi:MAG: outer membrane beta-barrel protein [Bacteroidota bacterium]